MAALRWITLHPAWALGIDDQTGSLEVGKRGDLVVWDGHPFSVYSKARGVFVGGALRWASSGGLMMPTCRPSGSSTMA